MMFIIVDQCTNALQNLNAKSQSISCGNKYLEQTIGLSLTENHLYQFIYINDTIKIIQYNYRKLIKNNDKYDYKLNIIDGHIMLNGLYDIIPTNIVEKLMSIIQWNGNNTNETKKPLLSISMSINKNGKIHIYLLKSYDQLNYLIGDYNQNINKNKIEIFYAKHSKKLQIMGTISDHNHGIIAFYYSNLSYLLRLFKLSEDSYASVNYEWNVLLTLDQKINYIYQLNEKPTNKQQKQQLSKSFQRIFNDNHMFTYGFVDINIKQIFLFSNLNEKLLTFSMDIFKGKTNEKFTYQLKIYRNFFYCQQDETNNENEEEEFDDFFTVQRLSTITSKSITTSEIDDIIHINNDDNHHHHNKKNETKKNQSKNLLSQSLTRLLFISIIITIFGPLSIITMVVCYRNCKYYYFHKNMVKRIDLQKSNRSYPIYQQYFFSKKLSPKKPKKQKHHHHQQQQQQQQQPGLSQQQQQQQQLDDVQQRRLPYSPSALSTQTSDSLNRLY
ncbi:hypothetical protein DERP_004203 [Dermatophagoides pteronyssinus]|uniref:Uncharacterized protein n=1 Tax=Dermatophagoides pteronyssinus TaxID=6956 RepID=A0ABQ8J8I3_DERPT|nr:hypothetical protein DERP_004203 [Dermatophagoides pteronyssinus]